MLKTLYEGEEQNNNRSKTQNKETITIMKKTQQNPDTKLQPVNTKKHPRKRTTKKPQKNSTTPQ